MIALAGVHFDLQKGGESLGIAAYLRQELYPPEQLSRNNISRALGERSENCAS